MGIPNGEGNKRLRVFSMLSLIVYNIPMIYRLNNIKSETYWCSLYQ